MSDERWGYATDKHAETWTGCYATREEAVEAGQCDYATARGHDPFWVHSGHVVSIETVMPCVDDIVEGMRDRACDEAGEVAEEYPDVTNEALIELEGLIRGWVEKYATPEFWVADGEAEFIPAPEPAKKENANG